MHQYGGKEKQLHLGQLLPDAPPLSHWENHHAASEIFVDEAVLIQKSRWVKVLWVGPLCWVVIHWPLINKYHGVLGNEVAHYEGVGGGGVRDGNGHEAAEPHGLVQESHDVGQAGLIFSTRQAVSANNPIHFFLHFGLHFGVPAI